MTLLKRQIVDGAYSVDAQAVANEMIAKMRLLRLMRRTLFGGGPEGRGGPGTQPRS